MEKEKRKGTIKFAIFISVIIISVVAVAIIMLKYAIEGETNMPFILSKITIVSTAEGLPKQQEEHKWALDLVQNNDIYFQIDRNPNFKKQEKIEKIIIENFKTIEKPKVGMLKKYMPNSTEGRLFTYSDAYLVNTKLEYMGASKDSNQDLQIGNQGGMLVLRYTNTQIGEYVSDEEGEIVHDGTLLQKIGITEQDLRCKVSFDFIIQLENKAFKTTVLLELPSGNILENGTTSMEKTDLGDLVFKRISR